MGWLGWPPDVALDTPMPLTALALKGRVSMVRALRGEAVTKTEPTHDPAETARRTRLMFRGLARKAKRAKTAKAAGAESE